MVWIFPRGAVRLLLLVLLVLLSVRVWFQHTCLGLPGIPLAVGWSGAAVPTQLQHCPTGLYWKLLGGLVAILDGAEG